MLPAQDGGSGSDLPSPKRSEEYPMRPQDIVRILALVETGRALIVSEAPTNDDLMAVLERLVEVIDDAAAHSAANRVEERIRPASTDALAAAPDLGFGDNRPDDF